MKQFLFSLGLLAYSVLSAQRQTLEKGWKFTREDQQKFSQEGFNDSRWQSVTLPHDWAIYGPFDIENDVQRTAIKQDGQKAPIEHSGRTGGLPFVGVGWYRTSFNLPKFNADQKVFVLFDGAMSNAQVFVNTQEAGSWKNGYNSFFLDITNLVRQNRNSLAVRLENFEQQSRWYPGAGLYRNVHIITKNKTHIPIWGAKITTPIVEKNFAKVEIATEFVASDPNQVEVEVSITNPQGTLLKSERTAWGKYSKEGIVEQALYIENPLLWDIKQPNLYTATIRLFEKGVLKDEIKERFGVRTIEVRPNEGFFLNKRKIKFQGVCLHHDLGPLGAAVNEAAIRRQITLMQEMGANAIRTSHNMPAPELVRLADEMGMLLAVESFDEWAIPKVENGYNRFFKEWAEKDLTNLVRQYRNSASVVMWFIGNEVEEQSDPEGAKVARWLQDIIQKIDGTRPVSNGMDRPDHIFKNNMGATMQIAGFNYRPFKYQEAYKLLPQQLILGSETTSTISSRGVYKFPVERKSMPKYPDQQTSSYDVEHCGWSNLPEDDFLTQERLPYTMGEFIWTGIDYLGEPTPYYSEWPAHSSYFGAVDLAGIPKDRFYLYRSHWNAREETIHILPHWNWEGREGQVTPIFVYTNYPAAEVFINGKSQGIQRKDKTISLEDTENAEAKATFKRQKMYRLMWFDTKYEKGEVRVVVYDENNTKRGEKVLRTAGKPYALRASADRKTLSANGKDLSYITIEVVDKDGIPCPTAQDQIQFQVTGSGTYRAAANGDATSLEQFHLPKMKLFNGKLVAIVQSKEEKGKIIFTAKAKGLKEVKVELTAE